jgi:hypothetical protein
MHQLPLVGFAKFSIARCRLDLNISPHFRAWDFGLFVQSLTEGVQYVVEDLRIVDLSAVHQTWVRV